MGVDGVLEEMSRLGFDLADKLHSGLYDVVIKDFKLTEVQNMRLRATMCFYVWSITSYIVKSKKNDNFEEFIDKSMRFVPLRLFDRFCASTFDTASGYVEMQNLYVAYLQYCTEVLQDYKQVETGALHYSVAVEFWHSLHNVEVMKKKEKDIMYVFNANLAETTKYINIAEYLLFNWS